VLWHRDGRGGRRGKYHVMGDGRHAEERAEERDVCLTNGFI
jgi:hypothetical protein